MQKIGNIIYKQFINYIPLDEMSGLQWFALEKNYGESYGNINKKYVFIKEPNLLNIGHGNVREMIENYIRNYDERIIDYSNPDKQYSGGKSNAMYHNIVKKYFDNEYDGTIIDENDIIGSNKYSTDDLIGASEIVIWKNYSNLLKEISDGGKKRYKTKRYYIKRYKTKRCKTKKTRKYKINKSKKSYKY